MRASPLFDGPRAEAHARPFVDSPDHVKFVAYEDGEPVGFVSGVLTTHPDKGTEMFIYELGVAEAFRRRGIARALVSALRDHAGALGCYGMWVLTDADSAGALAAYRDAGARPPTEHLMLEWELDAG